MPVASLTSILRSAAGHNCGVLAINVFDELTMRTAIQTAESERSPIVIQTSVKTVKAHGAEHLSSIFKLSAERSAVPVALHLDHCPERAVVTDCVENGWNSVLFDASHLPLDIACKETKEVVAEAHARGVDVEGEVEGIQGVEDGVGSEDAPVTYGMAEAVDFIRSTEIDCFAPAIGNAHGLYKTVPELNSARVRDLYQSTGIPMALHGGSGLTAEQFRDLIAAGCLKVNISTALKRAFISTHRSCAINGTNITEPLTVIARVRASVADVVRTHIHLVGSAGVVA